MDAGLISRLTVATLSTRVAAGYLKFVEKRHFPGVRGFPASRHRNILRTHCVRRAFVSFGFGWVSGERENQRKRRNLPDGRRAKAAIRLENRQALGLPFLSRLYSRFRAGLG